MLCLFDNHGRDMKYGWKKMALASCVHMKYLFKAAEYICIHTFFCIIDSFLWWIQPDGVYSYYLCWCWLTLWNPLEFARLKFYKIWYVQDMAKNIEINTAHAIVIWPNPNQRDIIRTSDLMMIIRQSLKALHNYTFTKNVSHSHNEHIEMQWDECKVFSS